ncbi:MAG: UDP-2,3-diacylglucosamine diphosphatase [Planctomycetota bacterium]
MHAQTPRPVRSLFVSDVHLGCRFCQPEKFLEYFESFQPERVYLLGDFLDGRKLKSQWRWEPAYTQIICKLLDMAADGVEVYYTPGNHDAFLRSAHTQAMLGLTSNGMQIEDEFVFESQSGKRFLLIHGDRFDIVEERYRWLSYLGTIVYEPLLAFNWVWSKLRRRPGKRRSPYSFCAKLKRQAKAAVRYVSNFEQRLFNHARVNGCDGVVCGHIHSPGVTQSDDFIYVNTGDWVENCTALVEELDGSVWLESFFSGVERVSVLPPTNTPEQGGDAKPARPAALPASKTAKSEPGKKAVAGVATAG